MFLKSFKNILCLWQAKNVCQTYVCMVARLTNIGYDKQNLKCLAGALVSTYMLIASAWKLIAFEYENNESRESNNHTKRLKDWIGHLLKRHLTETLTWVNNLKSGSYFKLLLIKLKKLKIIVDNYGMRRWWAGGDL